MAESSITARSTLTLSPRVAPLAAAVADAPAMRRARSRRLLPGAPAPRDAVRHLGPNWFASVMGTGIVANALMLLPFGFPGQHAAATAIWIVAAGWLVALLAATAAHWLLHPANARAHLFNPAMAPFYGAPPMALLTVGSAALLAGRAVVGDNAAVDLDAILWTVGTLGGLLASATVPFLMFTRFDLDVEHTFGSWLMPVVPPMVSAATGAALIDRLPAGQAQLTLLIACYAMFGLSLLASLATITLLWGRLVYRTPGPARMVPTLWLVLGPLGQGITAAALLGAVARDVLPAPYGGALLALGVVYGLPVLGFALLWLAIAAAITAKTARARLPFSLTWWSFTFPVGTLVTGTSELAVRTGSDVLAWLAGALFAFLVAAWLTAAATTLRGVRSGALLRPA
jgi:C4-dicarboxylate transporter/malic acid transport protein